MIILLTAGSFLSGSLMFSYWLGLMTNKDLKAVGDGNPGAMNLWKSSGYLFGIAGIMLDFLKGYVPLMLIRGSEYAQGNLIIPLAIAPIAGHAFSPFLRGRGGKAIAVTFGIWSALTGFEISLVYAVILALLVALTYLINKRKCILNPVEAGGLQVVTGMLLLSIYLILSTFSAAIWWVWLGNFVILVYTHRMVLRTWIRRGGSEASEADQ